LEDEKYMRGKKQNIIYPELQKRMAEQDLSTRKLAEKVAMSQATLSRKLNGQTRLYLDEAMEIAYFLEGNYTKIADLFSTKRS
jgi:transcriptional regulator with XRE-family HTH domain